jgi:hypothetical protein
LSARPIFSYGTNCNVGGFARFAKDEVFSFDLALRPQKAAPEVKFCHPAGLVAQLALLARVLAFVPHDTTLRFPVYVDSGGKPGNGKDY